MLKCAYTEDHLRKGNYYGKNILVMLGNFICYFNLVRNSNWNFYCTDCTYFSSTDSTIQAWTGGGKGTEKPKKQAGKYIENFNRKRGHSNEVYDG